MTTAWTPRLDPRTWYAIAPEAGTSEENVRPPPGISSSSTVIHVPHPPEAALNRTAGFRPDTHERPRYPIGNGESTAALDPDRSPNERLAASVLGAPRAREGRGATTRPAATVSGISASRRNRGAVTGGRSCRAAEAFGANQAYGSTGIVACDRSNSHTIDAFPTCPGHREL